MASKKTGVRPGRKAGTWSVVLNDVKIAQYDSEEEAIRMFPILQQQRRAAVLENLNKIRAEAAAKRRGDGVITTHDKKAYMKEYRIKNRERLSEKQKEYCRENAERIREYNKKRNANKPKVARAAGLAEKPPRQRPAMKPKPNHDLKREELAQRDHIRVRNGELDKIRGSISEAILPVDPNRQILRTDHLPTFSWSRNHYERH